MLGTGEDGGECCGKAIGEVDPSTLGKITSLNKRLLLLLYLNSINPNIKVSIAHNLHSINFLDCNVFKNHSKLSTKVFFKPTDTHKLLHPKSYHPAHVFKGIVKAQLLRYIRLSSHFHDFMQSYRILKSNLLNYGYTRSFLRFCKQSALSLTNCQRNSMITGYQPCRSKQCRMYFYTRSTAIVTSNLHNHTSYYPKHMLQHAQLHLHDSLHSVHTHSYYLRGRNQELHSIPILTTQTQHHHTQQRYSCI